MNYNLDSILSKNNIPLEYRPMIKAISIKYGFRPDNFRRDDDGNYIIVNNQVSIKIGSIDKRKML